VDQALVKAEGRGQRAEVRKREQGTREGIGEKEKEIGRKEKGRPGGVYLDRTLTW
jgi:hypothetical protein